MCWMSFAEEIGQLGVVVRHDVLEKNPAWTVPIERAASVLSADLAPDQFSECNVRELLGRSPIRTNGTQDVVVLAQAVLLALDKDGLVPASTFESAALLLARRIREADLLSSEKTISDVAVLSHEVRCGDGTIWFPLLLDGGSVELALLPGNAVLAPYWGARTSIFALPRPR